jgi:hypothetical protein
MLEINSLQEIEALRDEDETTSFDAEPQPHQKQRGGEKGGRKSAQSAEGRAVADQGSIHNN